MSGPTGRLLALLSLLQTPRTWPGSELARRLEVTHRTVRRDVGRLRELGYPVEADLGTHGGYRLVAGSAMPPLLLEDDEAVAVALGLRTVAVAGLPGLEEAGIRALAKLARSLPSRLQYRVRTLGATAGAGAFTPASSADPDVLTVLAAAAANRERVRMRYESRDGEVTRRHVEPQHLVSSHQRWYLVAFDVDRGEVRQFRVDRVHAPRATGGRSQHEPADDPRSLLEETALAMAPVHRADVTVCRPLADVRARLRDYLADGTLRAEGDDTRWHSAADTVEWLAVRLLALDSAFVVHGPPELQAHLRLIHERTAARVECGNPPNGVPEC